MTDVTAPEHLQADANGSFLRIHRLRERWADDEVFRRHRDARIDSFLRHVSKVEFVTLVPVLVAVKGFSNVQDEHGNWLHVDDGKLYESCTQKGTQKGQAFNRSAFCRFCGEQHNVGMPSRNIVRQDMDYSFYHVYARGAAKAAIFLESSDKDYFLYLLSRHLSLKPVSNKLGYTYPHFRNRVELASYCLMDNHFHLLFYQRDNGALSALMKSVMVAYSVYFNRKYKRTGPLFENRFKASLINKDAYLIHVSRYIHLNPRSWKLFPYSSLKHIRKGTEPEWLQTGRVIDQYSNRNAYLSFVADYESHKQMLDELRYELANM